jgi:hypothetical protein
VNNSCLTSAPVDAGSYLVSCGVLPVTTTTTRNNSVAEPLIINKADTTTLVTVSGRHEGLHLRRRLTSGRHVST